MRSAFETKFTWYIDVRNSSFHLITSIINENKAFERKKIEVKTAKNRDSSRKNIEGKNVENKKIEQYNIEVAKKSKYKNIEN